MERSFRRSRDPRLSASALTSPASAPTWSGTKRAAGARLRAGASDYGGEANHFGIVNSAWLTPAPTVVPRNIVEAAIAVSGPIMVAPRLASPFACGEPRGLCASTAHEAAGVQRLEVVGAGAGSLPALAAWPSGCPLANASGGAPIAFAGSWASCTARLAPGSCAARARRAAERGPRGAAAASLPPAPQRAYGPP